MASEDRILKILLQIQSDVSGLRGINVGLGETKQKLEESAKAGFTLRDAFRFAGAEEALRRTLDVIKEIPMEIGESVKKGIEFTAEIQRTQVAIAGLLRQESPTFFSDFDKANQAAAETIDLLKKKANDLGVAYTDMFEAFSHSQAQIAAGGETNIQKQIDLIAVLNRAMQSLGVNSQQAARDIGDILQGQASRTLGGARLAAAMGFSKEDLDQAILQMKQTGTLAEGLTSKLAGFQEAGRAAGQTFSAEMQRMRNAILDLEQETAKPIMGPLTDAIREFTADIKSGGDTLVAVQILGQFLANLVVGFTTLAQTIGGATETLARFASVAASLGGNPLLGYVLGKAGQGVGDLASNNATIAISKQADAIIKQITAAETLNQQAQARVDLESTIFAIKQKIGALADADKPQAEGQLHILEEMVPRLDNYFGTAQKITAVHIEDKNVLEAIKEAHDKIKILQDTASGDKEAVAADRAKLAYDEILKALIAKHVPEAEAKQIAQEYADATKAAALAKGEEKDQHKEVAELLREESLLMQDIRAQQRAVSENPFLGADEKQAQLHDLFVKEQQATLSEMGRLQSALAGGTIADPLQIEQVTAKLHALGAEYIDLEYKIQTSKFGGALRSELTGWANSFGTTAHQVAGIITGTLNTAIQGTSQALTGLIFGTQNWRQAFASAAQSIVGNIIQIALQWIISRTIMAALNRAFGATDAAATSAQATGAAAAWAPAAVAASIASYGAAAGVGLAAYVAAIVSGEATTIGLAAGGGAAGFKKGGFTGAGGEDEIAGPAHKGEFIFTHDQTRNVGIENLAAMARAAESGGLGHYAQGGRVATENGSPYAPSGGLWPPESYRGPVPQWVQDYFNSGGVEPPPIGSGSYNPPSSGGPATGSNATPPSDYSPGMGGDAIPRDPNMVTVTDIAPGRGHNAGVRGGLSGGFGAGGGGWGVAGGGATGFAPAPGSFSAGGIGGAWSSFGAGVLGQLGLGGGGGIPGWGPRILSEGGRIPGEPSSTDNMLNWNATGEYVISAPSTQWGDHTFGPKFFDDLNARRIPVPTHFDLGGRVSSSPTGSSAEGAASRGGDTHVFNFFDRDKLVKQMRESTAFRKIFIDVFNDTRIDLGAAT
jgi:hypothetical protein